MVQTLVFCPGCAVFEFLYPPGVHVLASEKRTRTDLLLGFPSCAHCLCFGAVPSPGFVRLWVGHCSGEPVDTCPCMCTKGVDLPMSTLSSPVHHSWALITLAPPSLFCLHRSCASITAFPPSLLRIHRSCASITLAPPSLLRVERAGHRLPVDAAAGAGHRRQR